MAKIWTVGYIKRKKKRQICMNFSWMCSVN
jgi:hypothetical protein